MSDFSSEFGALYIGIITIASMIACAILRYNGAIATTQDIAAEEAR